MRRFGLNSGPFWPDSEANRRLSPAGFVLAEAEMRRFETVFLFTTEARSAQKKGRETRFDNERDKRFDAESAEWAMIAQGFAAMDARSAS